MRSLVGGVLDLVSRTPVKLSDGPGSLRNAVSLMAQDKHHEDETGAMGAVGTLFAIVNKTSTACSLVDWHLYRKSRDNRRRYGPSDETRTEVTVHQALNVLNRPNDFTTRQELIEAGQQHIDLTGEGWFLVSYADQGKTIPAGLWGPIHPAKMMPVPSAESFLAGYLYLGPDGQKIPLDLKDVIFIRMPDPDNPWRGMSAVRALRNDLMSAKYTSEWNARFFANSAEPGGIIELDVNLSDTEFYQMRERWNEQHRGISKAHRVALLEQGHWVQNSFSQRDMQFVELRTASRDTILEAFAFPKSELGITEDVNKANAETGQETYAKGLIVPRLERWKSALNNDFLPLFGAGSDQLEFDYDSPVPDNVYENDQSLTARVNAWNVLVAAGVDPVAAAEICDLPIDSSVTITKPVAPAPVGPPAPSDPNAPNPPPNTPPKALIAAAVDAVVDRMAAQTSATDWSNYQSPSDVDLGPVARSYQQHLDDLLAEWQSVRGAQARQLADQIEQLITANNIAGLPEMHVDSDRAAKVLEAAMVSIGSTAANQVVTEARRQGVQLSPSAPPPGSLGDAATAVAGQLANGLVLSAAGEALRLAGGGTPSEVADSVLSFLNGLTDAQPKQALGFALHQAQHAGRIATFEDGEAEGFTAMDGTSASVEYYASEVNDQNTCSACSDEDGKLLGTSVVDTESDYPVGGFVGCEGGNRCRGQVVALWTIGGSE